MTWKDYSEDPKNLLTILFGLELARENATAGINAIKNELGAGKIDGEVKTVRTLLKSGKSPDQIHTVLAYARANNGLINYAELRQLNQQWANNWVSQTMFRLKKLGYTFKYIESGIAQIIKEPK